MYLLKHEAGQMRVEQDAASVVSMLAKGGNQWRAWELETDEDDCPVIGIEMRLGEPKVVAEISEYPLLRADDVVGSGQTRSDRL